jgi:hypothetical protein
MSHPPELVNETDSDMSTNVSQFVSVPIVRRGVALLPVKVDLLTVMDWLRLLDMIEPKK